MSEKAPIEGQILPMAQKSSKILSCLKLREKQPLRWLDNKHGSICR
jgi:hypothetical protein